MGFFKRGIRTEAEEQYNEGMKILDCKPEEAFELIRSAADMGHALAQFQMGIVYECGVNVATNSNIAAQWYEKSVNNGYIPAALYLARLHINGLDSDEDENITAEYLDLVFHNYDERDISEHLDVLYEVGTTVYEQEKPSKNTSSVAVKILERASNAGNEESTRFLEQIGVLK